MAGLLAGAAEALAVPIHLPDDPPIGYMQYHALPGTTWEAQPGLKGEVLEDETGTISYVYCPPGTHGSEPCYSVTGSAQSLVVRSFADRSIDFYWRFQVDVLPPPGAPAGGGEAAYDVSIRGVYRRGFTYDANTLTDVPGTPINGITVIGNVGEWGHHYWGDILIFAHPHVGKGWSAVFMLDTDAKAYGRVAGVTFDSEISDRQRGDNVVWTFAPVIPEPNTAALCLAGLAMLMVGLRHKRRRASWLQSAAISPPASCLSAARPLCGV
ncbi:hypothetical protein [Caldimonas brevitalea]|uniref:hypothetical protein n=1 Tax=Caldimonas brevitalea TaxID=413882 RepID=UPI0012FBAFC1|nr:hypothetical protein [Caldimonas brevitalea]